MFRIADFSPPAKVCPIMAWRIDEYLIHGEIDNRTPGRVTGRLWFLGREDEPVVLDLEGNAWRDVAGHVLRFTNPTPATPEAGFLDGLAATQSGVVGDITASRKVKVPDCPMEEVMRLVRAGEKFPWHWGNSLYLEWHSERNGRVVIESANYQIEIDAEAAWTMSEAEETAQQETNGRAMVAFMERLADAVPDDDDFEDFDEDDETDDDDAPTSAAEAVADAEQARMDLLLDRVQARIKRALAAGEEPDHEAIFEEERERLRRERGEPDPEPTTPEEEAERAAWITAMNAAAEEALAASDDYDDWKDDEDREHPLVARCHSLHLRFHHDSAARGWLTDADPQEHPLRELEIGVMIAGGKLAGALNSLDDEDDWPPGPLFAGDTLVRLKKARGHLRDSLAGADAAAEQSLADPAWLAHARADLVKLLAEVETLVAEVRAVLETTEEE